MKEAEVAEVTIAPAYAFGENPDPQSPLYNPKVPANATVVYRVELVSFVKVRIMIIVIIMIMMFTRFQSED